MTEAAKTIAHVAAAVVVLVGAFVSRPKPPSVSQDGQTGKVINKVDDPLSATRLKVVKYDEATSSLSNFEVAKIDGMWAIPSHDNYPADADRQMADAATSVMNLQILSVATTERGDHATYGVVDPDPDKLKAGAIGVGTQVTMENAKSKKLVNMIIGKEVKDQDGQRYVREVGRDPVYVVKVDPSKLSTKFADWIEKDLLKLNPWDVHQVTLKDYTVDLALGASGLEINWDRRTEMTFAYDDGESAWSADELKVFDRAQGQFQDVSLAEDEEVDKDKLNGLKTALDDLKIVDVDRKPEGLSRDLKAQKDFAKNREAVENLWEKGFLPVQVSDNDVELLSTDGDVVCQMKDGVEYVLRFGKLVLRSGAADAQDADKAQESAAKSAAAGEDAEKDEDEKGAAGIDRYLFVMARFNPNVIAQPDIEDLPELPEGAKAGEQKEQDSAAAEQKEQTDGAAKENDKAAGAASEAPAAADDATAEPDAGDHGEVKEEDADEAGAPDNGTPDKGTPDKGAPDAQSAGAEENQVDGAEVTAAGTAAEGSAEPASDTPAETPAAETTGGEKADAEQPDAKAAGAEKAAEKAADKEAGEKEADGDSSTADQKDEKAAEGETKDKDSLEELIKKRKEIEKENQRKLDEYQEKIKKAKDRVQELNDRFADFYYIISDGVFQKIHLERNDCIKKKEKSEDAKDQKDEKDATEQTDAAEGAEGADAVKGADAAEGADAAASAEGADAAEDTEGAEGTASPAAESDSSTSGAEN